MMGLVSSPYFTIKSTLLAYEVANGNRKDPKKAMQWNHANMNLPGFQTYDPQLPLLGLTLSSKALMGYLVVTIPQAFLRASQCYTLFPSTYMLLSKCHQFFWLGFCHGFPAMTPLPCSLRIAMRGAMVFRGALQP